MMSEDLENHKFSISDNCTTPDRQPGECVRLSLCKPLRDLIRKKPLPYIDRLFLRQSQCDFSEGSPWVCCHFPEVQNTTQKPSSTNRINFESNASSDPKILPTPGEGVCGKPFLNVNNRIYGGMETNLGEFPW